jgi:hypothetical protein
LTWKARRNTPSSPHSGECLEHGAAGTTRTCRGGLTTSAVGGRTDTPSKRADFRV